MDLTEAKSGKDPYKCGYLQKKTKQGKWQKRWFETNGIFLTYYKNQKMKKLLAAVKLPEVGEISLIDPHPDNDDTVEPGLFSIQLNSREYILKAPDHAEAVEWVKILTNLKESESKDTRMHSTGNSAEDPSPMNDDDENPGPVSGDIEKRYQPMCPWCKKFGLKYEPQSRGSP